MAMKQASALVGINERDVRPGRPIRMETMEDVAGDQAFVYESITGYQVPNGGGIQATPHVHDGTTGLVLPHPLAHGICNADLPSMSASASTEGYGKLVYTPFPVPPGVTRVVFVATSHSIYTRDFMRVNLHDDTLSPIEIERQPTGFTAGQAAQQIGLDVMRVELTTDPGSVNILNVECYDGYNSPGSNGQLAIPRSLISWAVYPIVMEGAQAVSAWVEPQIASTRVKVPGLTQHLGAYAYTSMDEGFFTDKRSINAWMTQGVALNDALNVELGTGRPAGGNASTHTNDRRYEGHTHGYESDLDNTGPLIFQPLGAWSYGVARKQGLGNGHMAHDMVDSGEPSWQGHIFAPTLQATTTEQVIAHHRLRLPALDEQHARDSVGTSSTKIRVAALVRLDTGKASQGTVHAQLRSSDGATTGTKVTANTTTNGLRLLELANLDASADPGNTGIIQQLLIGLSQNVASFPAFCCYGVCAWLEP